MQRKHFIFALVALGIFIFACVPSSFAQGNTATLSGSVTDPQGLAVKGAHITVTNKATGAQRSAIADDSGHYSLVELPPGEYALVAEGPTAFANSENPSVVLTVGEQQILNVGLPIRGQVQTVTVTTNSEPIETTKTEVSQTVEQRRIEDLPINGRKFTDFALTDSTAHRDVAPTIGPAPNSGYSVGGARARSNTVSVDGANAVDNSVNGIRPTISQEGVQEFQLITSNYNAEYGQATGGVINIVTKSGANDMHGDLFGFFRNKSFQARNAFSGEVDPATGKLNPIKQAFTRVQAGVTLGGALKKDKTFYFFSYEYTQREETGFDSIGAGNFGLAPLNCGGCGLDGLPLTSAQSAAVLQLLQTGNPLLQNLAGQYAALLGSASSVAVNKIDPGLVCGSAGLCPLTGVPEPGTPGARFPVPVNCPANATVNNVQCTPFGVGLVPLPASYVGLNSLRGNFPVSEKTSLWSLRLDHHWSDRNISFLRVGVSPSLVTGIESTSQNQVSGQNAGTRAGVNQSRDLNFTVQHDTIVSPTATNTFRFQFARRGVHFGFSQLPGGDQIGVNIPGYAYFGREPYSTVDRIERRTQFTDDVSLVRGRHTFKFGGDVNIVQLRSAKSQIFELDFGGDVNFGGLAASVFGFPDCVPVGPGNCIALPGATGLQAYGLGIPTTYIQGIGTSNQPFDNLPFGFFAQDSWRISRKLTMNYGVRYDVEITPLFAPATAINQQAEKALGVVEGIPRDYNNVAPRIGLAWDPSGDGRTVVRAGYGLFYDHPLLAIAFNSVTADGGRSVQLLSAGGQASACGLIPGSGVCGGSLDTPTNLNGSSIFQGVLNSLTNMFYLPNQQRFDPLAASSLFANQNYLTAGFPLPILPFTLPVDKKFVFGYSQQANLTVERQIAGTWRISAGYQWTRGLHLNRPVDINYTDPVLLTNNLYNADAAGLGFSNPLSVAAPAASTNPTATSCGVNVIAPSVLGFLNCPSGNPFAALNGKPVGTAAFFNFFRRSGPNPSFAGLAGGYLNEVGLAQLAGYPMGFGVPVPFNSVDTQQSSGNSYYNALTVNLNKKFSKNFELLSSYTWSHAIDDSTDLQSTLEPADSRFPNLERSNSVNDQRHRWVTSGVYTSSRANRGDGVFKWLMGEFTVAPLIEVSSGRPFNVITGGDARLLLGASQDRPSVGGATSSPFIHGVTFTTATSCLDNAGTPFTVPGITPFLGCNGTLGRDRFTTPGFFQVDLRLAKRIPIGERFRMELIADGFNLLNRTNIAAVNQLCDPTAGAVCFAGQPTAAYDARQFQFAVKVAW